MPSIYNFNSSTDGGRVARKGFIYQDHVGVWFLLDIMLAEKDCDIFFENEDDIVVIKKSETPVLVEMIQVKSNNLTSRWSVAQVISLELLERSLKRGRCSEDVGYRIITSYDVDEDISVLKELVGTDERTSERLAGLTAKLIARKPEIPQNGKGHTVKDWVENCIWFKFPESIELLQNSNLVLLEKMLYDCFNIVIQIDQKQELYQKLLTAVQLASSLEETIFNKEQLQVWFEKELKNLITPTKGTDRLIQKMQYAGLENTFIETAKELRWAYCRETLENQYVGSLAINKFKEDAVSLLQDLKLQLDAGELENLGINEGETFHKYCLEQVSDLGAKSQINSALAKGCMYDITNRCQHRFKKPSI